METDATRGQRIRALREKMGWTQQELATRVGATKAAVSKWEAAASPDIALDTFFRLAAVFNVDPQELALGERGKSAAALATTHGYKCGPEGAYVGQEWEKLEQPLRKQLQTLIETLVARKIVEGRQKSRNARKTPADDDRPAA
jgi:transcriptional regulator with XRE-family HTH domain